MAKLLLAAALLALAFPAFLDAVPASGELLPDGRVFGQFVTDDGNAVVGIVDWQAPPGRPPASYTTRFAFVRGNSVTTAEFDGPFGPMALHPPGEEGATFLMQGLLASDDRREAVAWRAYRRTGKDKLRLIWSMDTNRWADSRASLRVSPDGKTWLAMAEAADDVRHSEGYHFALGRTGSARATHRETLTFGEPAPRGVFAENDFTFIDSEAPMILVPHAGDVYLLRFTDHGIDSRMVEQLQPVLDACGGADCLNVRWQATDRILWSAVADEWLAWNLWDLGASGFPGEPFLRRDKTSGEPHEERGFVGTSMAGDRWRVEHTWRSPHIEHLKERHVSAWLPSQPTSLAVSPNGRHALLVEAARDPDRDENLDVPQDSESPGPRFSARLVRLSPAFEQPTALPD